MFDLDALQRQVSRNCRISDARHAGLFSICGLALRLRDLYKWEKGLPPWREGEPGKVLDWIDRREQEWERLTDADFGPIALNGRSYDPFDTRAINRRLRSRGLFYGAGYATSLKPTFFLAVCEDRSTLDGTGCITLGRELARDLLPLPALTQDGEILLRRESARFQLWDDITYVTGSGRPALAFALDACGVPKGDPRVLRDALERILKMRQEAHLYHELGELRDTAFDRETWRGLVSEFPHTPVELLARALKDMLADTWSDGPLPRILHQRDRAAIGFYLAFFGGLPRTLFPELRAAFDAFAAGGGGGGGNEGWRLLQDAVTKVRDRAADLTDRLCGLYHEGRRRDDPVWAQREIETRILEPLLEKPCPTAGQEG